MDETPLENKFVFFPNFGEAERLERLEDAWFYTLYSNIYASGWDISEDGCGVLF